MHSALQKLLADIENTAIEIEREIGEVMVWFPMPPSDFIKNMNSDEAHHQFSTVICALYHAHSSMYYKKNPKLPASAGRKAQYDKLNENNMLSSVWKAAFRFLDVFYGDSRLAFKLATEETEGGIHQILRTISENILRQRIDFHIGGLIEEKWGNSMNPSTAKPPFNSLEKRERHVQSYKDHYSAFLPAQYLEENMGVSMMMFKETLARHHILMQRAKGLLR